jgi:hypothetical protein
MTAIRKIIALTGNQLQMEVPDTLKGKKVEVIVFPVTLSPKEKEDKKTYDFSDVAGKLNWTGDAVTEQRKLRDEW